MDFSLHQTCCDFIHFKESRRQSGIKIGENIFRTKKRCHFHGMRKLGGRDAFGDAI